MPVKNALDDPYAAMPKDDPYASLPDVSRLDANPDKEGTYRMLNQEGKGTYVPYSSIRRAMLGGYSMAAEDRPRFTADAQDDHNLSRFFPEVGLKQGVRITGINPAGQPIFGSADGPEGSAGKRFGAGLRGATLDSLKGMWDAVRLGPQNAEEAAIATDASGRGALPFKRLIIDPMRSEARKTVEEWNQPGMLHKTLAAQHALATLVPILGPAYSSTAERIGEQWATGDIAGSAGTLAGIGAQEAAPFVAGKVLRSGPIDRFAKARARGVLDRLVKPNKTELLYGKEPAEGLLREGIVGNNLEQLGDRAYDKLHEIGAEIDNMADKATKAGKMVDTSNVFDPLNEALANAVNTGNGKLVNRLLKVGKELSYKWQLRRDPITGKVSMVPSGRRPIRMTPTEALEFKRNVGERAGWSEDPVEEGVNKAIRATYGKIKDSLNISVKEMVDLNERYSNLVEAASAIKRQIPIERRHANWSLTDIALGATGHVPLAIARKIARLPAIRTRGAQFLYDLPKSTIANPPAALTIPAGIAPQIGNTYHQPTQFPTPPMHTLEDDPYAALVSSAGSGDEAVEGAISSAALVSGVNPDFLRAVIGQESGGNAGAVSVAGATGLMQLMPATAEKYGVTDPADPNQNVAAGARYLRELLEKHNGDVAEALKDYYGRGTPQPGYPSAEEYAQAVMNRFQSLSESPSSTPAPAPGQLAEVKTQSESLPSSPAMRAQNPPNKHYWQTATSPDDGPAIGTDDGVTWFDVKTGRQIG